jgi:hypothetical protein
MQRTTVFSPDRRHRYTLWRDWSDQYGMFDTPTRGTLAYANFICLNPSTADEVQDDPTIRRCAAFAKAWGFPAFCMTNLFAWRDTSPEMMMAAADPIGDDNDHWLASIARDAGIVVAGWGKHGAFNDRATEVVDLLRRHVNVTLHALRTNADGSPEHPLYIPAACSPITWPRTDRLRCINNGTEIYHAD